MNDRYQAECERVGFRIDPDQFSEKFTQQSAERVVELLSEAKTEHDLSMTSPIHHGRSRR